MNCTDGQGRSTLHNAEGWLRSPGGELVVAQCKRHALEVIDEYDERLGELWTFDLGGV